MPRRHEAPRVGGGAKEQWQRLTDELQRDSERRARRGISADPRGGSDTSLRAQIADLEQRIADAPTGSDAFFRLSEDRDRLLAAVQR